jgi:hypothetical protein
MQYFYMTGHRAVSESPAGVSGFLTADFDFSEKVKYQAEERHSSNESRYAV